MVIFARSSTERFKISRKSTDPLASYVANHDELSDKQVQGNRTSTVLTYATNQIIEV